MGPFKLAPAFKDYLWGGDKLKKYYNKQSELEILAESWELSAHKDGSSVIAESACDGDVRFIGTLFSDFIKGNPESVGTRAQNMEFPILIKLIDAKNDLSIQVHPDDEFARKYESSFGKTEMWHILEAEPDATLFVGFNRDVGREELAGLIETGEIISALNKIPIKRGDTFLIEAGTIHAINSGALLAEIQQNSNLTYRVYDYGRTGADGRPRELHTDKALKVINRKKYENRSYDSERVSAEGYDEKTLVRCPYFTVKSVSLHGEYSYTGSSESFASVLLTDGELEVLSGGGGLSARKGDSIFIPAGKTEPVLRGSAEFLLTTY